MATKGGGGKGKALVALRLPLGNIFSWNKCFLNIFFIVKLLVDSCLPNVALVLEGGENFPWDRGRLHHDAFRFALAAPRGTHQVLARTELGRLLHQRKVFSDGNNI